MQVFEWKESYNVGVPVIDAQHRALVDLLNECTAKAAGYDPQRVTEDQLDRLRRYAAFHFRFEEDVLRTAGYAELDRHRQEHLHFKMRVLELEGKSGSAELMELVTWLRDWFLHHILQEDRAWLKQVPAVKKLPALAEH